MTHRPVWLASVASLAIVVLTHCGQSFQAASGDGGLPGEGDSPDESDGAARDVSGDEPIQAPTPTTLTSQESVPRSIVVDDTRLYWVNAPAGGPQAVRSMLKDGTGAVTTLAQAQGGLLDIAIDDTAIYWSVNTNGPVPTAAQCLVMALAKGETAATCVVSAPASPSRIALDTTRVIILSGGANPTPTIGFALKLGSAYTSVNSNGPSAATAATDTDVFVGNSHGPHVDAFSLPGLGGVGNVCVTACGADGSVIVDLLVGVTGDSVVWATSAGDVVTGSTSLQGTTGTLLGSVPATPQRIARDASYVYVASSSGDIVAVPTTPGGTTLTLASGENQPFGITVDETRVYWTCADGSIRAVAVPSP